jgi:hypothetical protein
MKNLGKIFFYNIKRNAKEVAEKNYHIVMNDNNALQIKLENLE